MNTFPNRLAAIALSAITLFSALAAAPASASEFTVAGAPGLAHVVKADGSEPCTATVLSPNAVLTTATCVTSTTGRPYASKDVQVVEGDQTHPVSIVWVHTDAPVTDLAVLTLTDKAASEGVDLALPAVQQAYPALAVGADWVRNIVAASSAQATITTPAQPATEGVPTEVAPAEVVPAAVNPVRHFVRVKR